MDPHTAHQPTQWKDVHFSYIDECGEYSVDGFKGALFLTPFVQQNRVVINWLPDPDQDHRLPDYLTDGYELDVNDLSQLICRRLPGFRTRALFFVLRNSSKFGPFEFRTGGATDFIFTLNQHVLLDRSSQDKTLYNIHPYVSPTYQLPGSSRVPGRLSNDLGVLGNTALVDVGRHMRRFMARPLHNFLDVLVNPEFEVGQQVDTYGSTTANPAAETETLARLRTTMENDFTVVDVKPAPVRLPDLPVVHRGEPLNMEQWKRHLDPDGRVTCVEKLRMIIFEGGVSSNIRPILWKYLLGYYLWGNTLHENEERRIEKHREYYRLKSFWKEMSHAQLVRFNLFRDRKCYIDKDVPRTDRKTSFYRDDSSGNLTRIYDILMTYSIYNMDFGYYQGMNDLLAVVYYVIQHEEDAFWCFVGLMDHLDSNFDCNLNAVREQFSQLFELIDVLDPAFSTFLESKNAKEMPFCFRWLLIQFKREFSYKDVMQLWEAIWSNHMTNNFHIFFAAAVLLMQRGTIMSRNMDANGILKLVNDLSFNIPLETALNLATAHLKQLDMVLNSLPQSVRDIIEGPSLALSVHSSTQKSGDDDSDTNSHRFSCTWTLLNEEIEDLMSTDNLDSEVTVSEAPPSPPSVMIPIRTSTTTVPVDKIVM